MLVLLVLPCGTGFLRVVKNDYHCDEGITLALTNGTWPVHVATDHRLVWMDMGELSHRMFDSRLDAARLITTHLRKQRHEMFILRCITGCFRRTTNHRAVESSSCLHYA